MTKKLSGFRAVALAVTALIFAALGTASAATYSISYFKMQHRVYEDGSSFNRVLFYLKDENGDYVTTNVISDLKVTDPDGVQMVLDPVTVDTPYIYRYVSYDGDTGTWGSWGNVTMADMYVDFTDTMTTGTYTLEVTTIDGQVLTDSDDFTGSVDLPIVASSSFDLNKDTNGGLVWEWDIPEGLNYLDAGLETSSRGYIIVRQAGVLQALYSLAVPTHMGRVFLSKDMLAEVIGTGDEYGFNVQVRTNDGINRSGTDTVYVSSIDQPMAGSDDITLDSDLSFTIPDMTYVPLGGNSVNLEAAFKFFEDQNGTLLWELESYTIK